MAQIQELVGQIKTMTVLELNELVKALESEFGVSAAAAAMPVAFMGAAGAAAGPAEAVEEARSSKLSTCVVRVIDDDGRLVALMKGTAFRKDTPLALPT